MKRYKSLYSCALALLMAGTPDLTGAAEGGEELRPLNEWPQLLPAVAPVEAPGLSRASILRQLQIEEPNEAPAPKRRTRGRIGRQVTRTTAGRTAYHYPSTPKNKITAAQIAPSDIKIRPKLFLSFSPDNNWFDPENPANRVSLNGVNVASGKYSFAPGHHSGLQATIDSPYLSVKFEAPVSGHYAISCLVQAVSSGYFTVYGRDPHTTWSPIGHASFDPVQNAATQQIYFEKGEHNLLLQLESDQAIWLDEIAVVEI